MVPKAALALKRHLRPLTVLVRCEGPLLEHGEGGVAGADAEGRDGDLGWWVSGLMHGLQSLLVQKDSYDIKTVPQTVPELSLKYVQ